MDDSQAAATMQPPYLTTPAIRQRLDLLSHLLEFGLTRENMDAAFSLWWLILDQYTTYIGAK